MVELKNRVKFNGKFYEKGEKIEFKDDVEADLIKRNAAFRIEPSSVKNLKEIDSKTIETKEVESKEVEENIDISLNEKDYSKKGKK